MCLQRWDLDLEVLLCGQRFCANIDSLIGALNLKTWSIYVKGIRCFVQQFEWLIGLLIVAINQTEITKFISLDE